MVSGLYLLLHTLLLWKIYLLFPDKASNRKIKLNFDIQEKNNFAPEETEKAGYSKSVRAILNTEKINTLGWSAKVSIEEGIKRTIKILQDRNYFF